MYKNRILPGKNSLLNPFAPWRSFRALEIFSRESHVCSVHMRFVGKTAVEGHIRLWLLHSVVTSVLSLLRCSLTELSLIFLSSSYVCACSVPGALAFLSSVALAMCAVNPHAQHTLDKYF